MALAKPISCGDNCCQVEFSSGAHGLAVLKNSIFFFLKLTYSYAVLTDAKSSFLPFDFYIRKNLEMTS